MRDDAREGLLESCPNRACDVLENPAFPAREPGVRNHRRCALRTGERIVDDFGIEVLRPLGATSPLPSGSGVEVSRGDDSEDSFRYCPLPILLLDLAPRTAAQEAQLFGFAIGGDSQLGITAVCQRSLGCP